LRRVDALGLGDHQASALDLDLELEMSIRLAQPIALGDCFVGARLLRFTRCALRGERSLELRDTLEQRITSLASSRCA